VLRHQLIVLRRRLHGRLRLTSHDRWLFIQLYRWFPSILQALTIIRPETLLRWHRAGFRFYWRWKSRPLGGRAPIDIELRVLIRRMSLENPVTATPTAEWVARQITEAFPWNEAQRYLIRDRDRITAASSHADCGPWASGIGPLPRRRLIGSIRRECVDHVVVLGETHLRRVLKSYAGYDNNFGTHRSLNKDAPVSRPGSANRKHQITCHPWRTSPSLRPGLSFRYTWVLILPCSAFRRSCHPSARRSQWPAAASGIRTMG
jgi:hypothetical protein